MVSFFTMATLSRGSTMIAYSVMGAAANVNVISPHVTLNPSEGSAVLANARCRAGEPTVRDFHRVAARAFLDRQKSPFRLTVESSLALPAPYPHRQWIARFVWHSEWQRDRGSECASRCGTPLRQLH